MKRILKNWSLFEILMLLINPTITMVVGIILKNDIISIITSTFGIIGVLCCAKGLVIGQGICLFVAILYSIVSFKNEFYGEVIIYVFYMIPMYIFAIVNWLKHKDKKTESVKIYSVKLKEWLVIIPVTAVAFVLFYFMLKALNTSELIVSTLSLIDNVFAMYLLARRSKYGFISYIVNDIILIILWGIPVMRGDLSLVTMMIYPIMNLINDVYAVVSWTKLQKLQINS